MDCAIAERASDFAVSLGARDALLGCLADGMPEGERLIVCSFHGDPGAAQPAAWRPRPWAPGRNIAAPPAHNAYVTVSSFRRAHDNSFRRRAETFAAGRALMVDDVGTKVPLTTVEHMPPTARVETSAGNEQWWYVLREPERDAARFDAVIRAFIAQRMLGADPGMSGVTRVGRLPGHRNGKPRNRNWICALRHFDPDLRFTIDQIVAGFRLQLMGRREPRTRLLTAEALERNAQFGVVYRWLRERRMLKRDHPDMSGWTEMRCPWRDEHTGGVDSGAAVREPAAENEYHGAFRCHHGHCVDRGWAELTEWVAEESAEELNSAADCAPRNLEKERA